MLKRITKLGWLTIALIVFLILTGMNHLTNNEPKQATNQLQRQTDVQLKDHILSQYPEIKVLLETKDTGKYHLAIEKPVTKGESVNNAINKWIDKQKEAFLKNVSDGDTEKEHPSIRMTTVTDKITDRYYQIQLKKNISDKGMSTNVFNVDIENDRILALEDVLKMDDDTHNTISEQAKEHNEDTSMTDEQLDEYVSDPDTWNWTVTSDAFTLYTDVADESDQIRTESIDIPLDGLYLNLNEDIVDIIDMPKAQQEEMEGAVQKEKERIEREKKKQEEQAAKEKAKQAQRKKNGADPDGKYVALSFDDGPSADVTPRVLDALADHGAVATFFMLGTEVDHYPEVAKQVADAGHEIGNHTKDHTDLTTLGPNAIQSEINDTSDTIEQTTGTRPYLVRSPYGAYNDTVINDIAGNGDSLALWSVDSKDWESQNANAVYNEVLQNVTSGSIVLMHDIHPTTADALPDLLTSLEEQGYQFVTISQLMEIQDLNGAGPFYGHTK